MDAATLYVTLTLASGKPDTSTYGFTSLRSCEESVEKLQALDRKDHRWGKRKLARDRKQWEAMSIAMGKLGIAGA